MKRFRKIPALLLCVCLLMSLAPCTQASSTEPTHLHKWNSWKTTVKATCTASGVRTRTCSICGATQRQQIRPTDHSWGDWTVLSEPARGVPGIRKHTCTSCGTTERAAFYPKGTLLPGSSGDEVKHLQEQLSRLGFHKGRADGKFGAKTESSLKDFQQKYHFIADGIAWPHIIRTLDELPDGWVSNGNGTHTLYENGTPVEENGKCEYTEETIAGGIRKSTCGKCGETVFSVEKDGVYFDLTYDEWDDSYCTPWVHWTSGYHIRWEYNGGEWFIATGVCDTWEYEKGICDKCGAELMPSGWATVYLEEGFWVCGEKDADGNRPQLIFVPFGEAYEILSWDLTQRVRYKGVEGYMCTNRIEWVVDGNAPSQEEVLAASGLPVKDWDLQTTATESGEAVPEGSD